MFPSQRLAGNFGGFALSAVCLGKARSGICGAGRSRYSVRRMNVPSPGSELVGRYRVIRTMSAGGMGTVVEALHLQLAQRVAIKFLLPDLCSQRDAVTRFLREARSTVQIESEHVARVTDVGTSEEGVPFLVMEYLEGLDLSDVLEREKRLPMAQAVSMVAQACDAIAEAHSLGIIHRDLKPSNLFWTVRRDGSRILKVLDFGISKAITEMSVGGAFATGTATVMGSPHYMSPEQVRSSKHVDPRADIWSLGVILHELLAGETPFKGESLPGVLASIVADPPVSLRLARPEVPLGLEAIVTRCLQKERSQRYPSVPELARALSTFAPPDAHSALLRCYSFALSEAARQSIAPPPPGVETSASAQPSFSVDPLLQPSTLPPPPAHSDTSRGLSRALRPKQERRVGLLLAGVLGLLAVVFAYVGYGSQPPSDNTPEAAPAVSRVTASLEPARPAHTTHIPLTPARWEALEQARGTGMATPTAPGSSLDDARLFVDRK
jgi:serine/threonine protein kinase